MKPSWFCSVTWIILLNFWLSFTSSQCATRMGCRHLIGKIENNYGHHFYCVRLKSFVSALRARCMWVFNTIYSGLIWLGLFPITIFIHRYGVFCTTSITIIKEMNKMQISYYWDVNKIDNKKLKSHCTQHRQENTAGQNRPW